MTSKLFALSVAAMLAGTASAQVRITEWMYSGSDGEFIEITNTGPTAVDMTGWSFDDNTRAAGSLSLAAFGILQPGQSAIISELSEAVFRANWNLPAWVPVIGGNIENLGRSDEVNIYNGTTLIDRLTYNDQAGLGPRTNEFSGITLPANWGANTAGVWFLSAVGDAYGSYAGVNGSVGSPGFVPTPGAAAVLGLGLVAAGRRRR